MFELKLNDLSVTRPLLSDANQNLWCQRSNRSVGLAIELSIPSVQLTPEIFRLVHA